MRFIGKECTKRSANLVGPSCGRDQSLRGQVRRREDAFKSSAVRQSADARGLFNQVETHKAKTGKVERNQFFLRRLTGKRQDLMKIGVERNRAKLRQIDLHWHDLRHEGACRLLADGVDIRTIQLMLGHADIKQTQRYLNITDEELRKAMTGVWERRRQLRAVSQ